MKENMKNKKTLLSLVCLITLSACSSIQLPDISNNSKKIEGIESYVQNWPTLTESIEYLNYSDLYQKCGQYKQNSKEKAKIYGCSEINLAKKTCTIFLPTNYESWALEHEKEHCKGGDHEGLLQDYYDKWTIYMNQKKSN